MPPLPVTGFVAILRPAVCLASGQPLRDHAGSRPLAERGRPRTSARALGRSRRPRWSNGCRPVTRPIRGKRDAAHGVPVAGRCWSRESRASARSTAAGSADQRPGQARCVVCPRSSRSPRVERRTGGLAGALGELCCRGQLAATSTTAMIPLRNTPSKVPAPPIDATPAPRFRSLCRLSRSAPIRVPSVPDI